MQVEATGQRFRLEEQMIKVKVEDGKIKELRVRLLLQHCYKMGTEYRAPQSANPLLGRRSILTCVSCSVGQSRAPFTQNFTRRLGGSCLHLFSVYPGGNRCAKQLVEQKLRPVSS